MHSSTARVTTVFPSTRFTVTLYHLHRNTESIFKTPDSTLHTLYVNIYPWSEKDWTLGMRPGGRGGCTQQVLYREPPPRGSNPYPSIYHF